MRTGDGRRGSGSGFGSGAAYCMTVVDCGVIISVSAEPPLVVVGYLDWALWEAAAQAVVFGKGGHLGPRGRLYSYN